MSAVQAWRREPRGYYCWTGLLDGHLRSTPTGEATVVIADTELGVEVLEPIDHMLTADPMACFEAAKERAHEKLVKWQAALLGNVCWPPLCDSGVEL